MPYHRRYHGDALQGYRILTLEQRGAYTTILDLIYDEGGPIDFNERWLAGEMGCSLRLCRKLIADLMEHQKIFLTARGQISNHRAETEIENALKISRTRAEVGAKRGSKSGDGRKFAREINDQTEQLKSKSAVIPVPIPYIDSSTTVDEDTGEPDPLNVASPLLLDVLSRRDGAPNRYAQTAATLRRRNGH